MRNRTLARRYARAAHALAQEQGSAELVQQSLETFARTWNEHEELRRAFENPRISLDARRIILREVAQSLELHPVVTHTLLLLSDRRRLHAIEEISASYQEILEKEAGRVRAEVVTATEMPQAYFEELQRVLEAATGNHVNLVTRVDPTLIGGVVTRLGDQIFDGSVRNQLHELEQNLLASSS